MTCVTIGKLSSPLLPLSFHDPYCLLFQKAIAAVGQGRLMSLYDDLFGQFNQPIAQILLTKNDLADVSSCLWIFWHRQHASPITDTSTGSLTLAITISQCCKLFRGAAGYGCSTDCK